MRFIKAIHDEDWEEVGKILTGKNFSSKDINARDEDGDTPLHLALKHRKWELVPRLIRNGADINIVNQCQSSVVHEALYADAPADIINLLISSYNINRQDEDGFTPLHLVVNAGKWQQVTSLLSQGADTNVRGHMKRTVLHEAACDNIDGKDCLYVQSFTQLISADNVNAQDQWGATPLHLVVKQRKWELVSVLLEHGADVDLVYQRGRVALHDAVLEAAPADIIPSLVSRVNINMPDADLRSPLNLVVENSSWELVPVLVQYGADTSQLQLADGYNQQTKCQLLQSLCVQVIRRHMVEMSDEALARLGLPRRLVEEVKLTSLAQHIVSVYHNKQ